MITRRFLLASLTALGFTLGCRKKRYQIQDAIIGETIKPKTEDVTFDDLQIKGQINIQMGGHAGSAIGVTFAGTVVTIAKLTLPMQARTLLRTMQKFNASLIYEDWKYIAIGVKPVRGTLHSHDTNDFILKDVECECDSIQRHLLRK